MSNMYSLILYVKNKENPYYKALLDARTKELFGIFNEILSGKASLGMKDDFGEQFGPFCSISDLPEEITLDKLTKLITLYETELKKKFGITEITFKFDKLDELTKDSTPDVSTVLSNN